MAAAYNPSSHDALTGDGSHFNDHFYQNDASSFPNMDPNLSGTGVDALGNTAVAANAHLAGNSSDYDAMLAHDPSISSGAGRQSLGADDALSVTATPARSGKASRACDECRRRKSKCTDGDPETGRACAPCRARAGPDADCHYNRMPMKRGPSKGYIQAMKGNVDDVSRVHRRLLAHVKHLEDELEIYMGMTKELVQVVTTRFGADALPSTEEVAKRIRLARGANYDNYALSLDGQKAATHYQIRFQNVLPFVPNSSTLFQTVMEEASGNTQNAFEYALQAINTPVCDGSTVDLARAELIEKVTASLDNDEYGPLYFATVGLLILAIQITGPTREYRDKLPNMGYLHGKAMACYAAMQPLATPDAAAEEHAAYVRSVAIGIRSILLITSIGSGEVFAIIDQIPKPGEEEVNAGEASHRFAKLAETFHSIYRSGLSTQAISFADLPLYAADLPLPQQYKHIVSMLRLLVCRLNTFTDTPNLVELCSHVHDAIDHLYHSPASAGTGAGTDAGTGAVMEPSCWLYYHGLALVVRTVGDLYLSDGDLESGLNREGLLALQKLKSLIERLPVESTSGWESAAMARLDAYIAMGPGSRSSSGRWRDVLVKDAYLRALDY